MSRRTTKQLAGGRREDALRELASQIETGRLKVRQMTPSEREEAERRGTAMKGRRPRG